MSPESHYLIPRGQIMYLLRCLGTPGFLAHLPHLFGKASSLAMLVPTMTGTLASLKQCFGCHGLTMATYAAADADLPLQEIVNCEQS